MAENKKNQSIFSEFASLARYVLSPPDISFLKYLFIREKASVIIPCFNEEATLGRVINECKKSRIVSEVIVVDDGSSDNSVKVAIRSGARLIRHKKNKGKGAAIISGAKKAKNDALVFIDADLHGFSFEVVEKLAFPLLHHEARICKASFSREGGRVTELTAKPLLEALFPEVGLSQPLSGLFAIRKELLLSLDIGSDWSIDISVVLSAMKSGERIAEADIGRLKHKHRSLDSLGRTAREITRSILTSAGFLAGKHKLVVFDFDHSLILGSSIFHICKKLGFSKKLAHLKERFHSGEISERRLTRLIARMFKGIRVYDFLNAASTIRKQPFAEETLAYLSRKGYQICVISFAFSDSIISAFQKSKFDLLICPVLDFNKGKFTGTVRIPPYPGKFHVFSKGAAMRAALRKLKARREETIAIGDSKADEEMFKEAGIPVAINSKKLEEAKMHISALPEILFIAD
ncbi:hypothetical protein COV61_00170 [Candidatus Micrarchaeota archaeon CG11_big_fil_rev_8_21_14_0_20_47_5]|nr:MAG: hypothetical protein AUJ17_03640 [Candidatus Micrarchaeota archaeon CG1_02_47_40]PIN84424.1 MAG: hypothetical protein COV61_00170 [Candidatus Micrarchaeota archaeon CG11_big_fil_rev_8_21_14_0_20_47_5]